MAEANAASRRRVSPRKTKSNPKYEDYDYTIEEKDLDSDDFFDDGESDEIPPSRVMRPRDSEQGANARSQNLRKTNPDQRSQKLKDPNSKRRPVRPKGSPIITQQDRAYKLRPNRYKIQEEELDSDGYLDEEVSGEGPPSRKRSKAATQGTNAKSHAVTDSDNPKTKGRPKGVKNGCGRSKQAILELSRQRYHEGRDKEIVPDQDKVGNIGRPRGVRNGFGLSKETKKALHRERKRQSYQEKRSKGGKVDKVVTKRRKDFGSDLKTSLERIKKLMDHINSLECPSREDFQSDEEYQRARLLYLSKFGRLDHLQKTTILHFWSDHWELSSPSSNLVSLATLRTEEGSFRCPNPDCNNVYTTRQGFQYHYKRCALKTLYVCKLCQPPTDEEFIHQTQILRHLIRHHLNDLEPCPTPFYEEVVGHFRKIRKIRKNPHPIAEKSNSFKRPKTTRRRRMKNATGFDYDIDLSIDLQARFADESQKSSTSSRHFIAEDRWRCHVSHWPSISSSELAKYTNQCKKSAQFRLGTTSRNVDLDKDAYREYSETLQIDIFSSLLGIEHSLTFFPGNCVTSSAWCPLPPRPSPLLVTEVPKNKRQIGPDGRFTQQEPIDQYIAVSVQKYISSQPINFCDSENSLFELDTERNLGTIQIWTCHQMALKLNKKVSMQSTLMMAHSFGRVTDMKWAPLGVAHEIANESHLQRPLQYYARLGLLAVSFADGLVRIFSVPKPESLQATAKQSFKPIPSVILERPRRSVVGQYRQVIVSCIDWSHTDQQRYIVAGYGDGLVCLWDLSTLSTCLITETTNRTTTTITRHIRPLSMWEAHLGPVTSLSFAPLATSLAYDLNEELLLLTGGYDRSAKIWNVRRPTTTGPLWSHTALQMIRSVCWSPAELDPGVLIGFDDGLRELDSNNQLILIPFDHRTTEITRACSTIAHHSTTITSIQMSPLNRMSVSVDLAGEVLVHTHVNSLRRKFYKKSSLHLISLYRVDPLSLSAMTIEQGGIKSESKNEEENSTLRPFQKLVNEFIETKLKIPSSDLINELNTVNEYDPENGNINENDDDDAEIQEIQLADCHPVPGNLQSSDPPSESTRILSVDPSEQDHEQSQENEATNGSSGKKKKQARSGRRWRLPPKRPAIDPLLPPLVTYDDWSSNSWGIRFSDNCLTNELRYPAGEITRLRGNERLSDCRPCDFPMIGVTRAEWSPNAATHNWLLTITGSGLCRLTCVQLIANQQ